MDKKCESKLDSRKRRLAWIVQGGVAALLIMHCLVILFCILLLVPLEAQTSLSSTATNNVPAAPTVTPVPMGDVVIQASATVSNLQNEKQTLLADPTVQSVTTELVQAKQDVDRQSENQTKLLAPSSSFSDLQSILYSWEGIGDSITSMKEMLSARAGQLSDLVTTLASDTKIWQATLTSAQANAAPVEALQQIQAVLTNIKDVSMIVHSCQAQVLAVQNDVVEQDKRVQACRAQIEQAREAARTELFKQDSPSLLTVSGNPNTDVIRSEEGTFSSQWMALESYFISKFQVVILHAAVFLIIAFCLHWVRDVLNSKAEDDAALVRAGEVFQLPISTALLLSLLASQFFYPLAPRILFALVGIAALIPVMVILKRLIEASLFPVLYAVVFTYLIDQFRYVLNPAGLGARFLLVFELLLGGIFLLWLLHSKRLSNRGVRAYMHVALIVGIFAGCAEVFGYTRLAELLSRGILKSSYLTIVFYAAARISDALVFAALRVPPLNSIKIVRIHQASFYRRSSIAITWIAVVLWALAALQLFEIGEPLWQYLGIVMNYNLRWGSLHVAIGSFIAFGFTVWLAFLISRVIRFVLEEEVYPHLQLSRGIPYAASMMVHYTILLLGFFASLQVLGVNLSNFSILAGAFGVGLGFGLQNIMNNFVSGLILLFERPIRVGDTIQVDSALGVVERIGIRASVVRLTNGSEVIVPNGNLISNPVVNWSLPENQRVVEIPIAVGPKADPNQILKLLTELASSDPRVLKVPAPQAFLVTITGTALTFRLRTYVDSGADFMHVTSDLSLVMFNALAKENIPLAP